MSHLYVGLMSGTSLDGVDAVLIESRGSEASAPPRLLHALALPYPPELKAAVLALCRDQSARLVTLGRLDVQLARWYSTAVTELLRQAGVAPSAVRAIGSHGQTVHHEPGGDAPFTLQLGDPNLLAVSTGITVVADFRRRDMALGGQGAPLAPGFHDAVFRHPTRCRVVLNCGGIANISVLAPGQDCIGYDTGPANILMDAWVQARTGQAFDRDGQWALQGQVLAPLLARMREDPYFVLPPPKSTGREYFHLAWVQGHLEDHRYACLDDPLQDPSHGKTDTANATSSTSSTNSTSATNSTNAASATGAANPANTAAVDVQRTLLELSASTVADAIARHADSGDLLVAGGGAYNAALLGRLQALCPHWWVATTARLGIAPEHVEATAFAVFAQRTLDGLTGNLPSVTGASRRCLLGGIYPP